MWVDAIAKTIGISKGHKEKLTSKNIEKPWKFDNISEQQFLDSADTGDILLFRSTNLVDGVIQLYGDSPFDHCAMVMKFESDPDEVYFLEANSSDGVCINKFSWVKQHIGKGQFYDKLVFRKVNFQNRQSTQCMEKLEKFINEILGNKYSLNADKLFMRKETVVHKDSKKLVNEGRDFFCSELLAKTFKILGVIQDDKTSCT